MSMSVHGSAHDEAFPPNYTIISLIDDCLVLRDETMCAMLLRVFEEFHEALVCQRSDESGFALLGMLLIGAKLGICGHDMEFLAGQLMEEESRCRNRRETRFLFGCTFYDQLNSLWKRYIEELVTPATLDLMLVRDSLLNDRADD
ncbi:MAG: hypothetical protein ACTHN5_04620 [Phycisphaerae bacterium]